MSQANGDQESAWLHRRRGPNLPGWTPRRVGL